ncbi:MAG TPA: HEPN domain-containing protein [Anaerolineaceae bacterium]|nr:HEPN domain-containing protein [Anaerolineaceae bacterium]
MNPLTLEWVDKAEGDLTTARREYRARIAPNFDAVCFHTQQAAEKYLKALLQESGTPIPRIHSLADLLALISKLDPDVLLIQANANVLEGFAVQYRYPGLSADKAEAKLALSAADRVCSFIRAKLGL